MPVNTERPDYKEMLPKWDRLRDCFNGRDAVIKKGPLYVPDLPGNDTFMNKSYRARGNFFNATKRTIEGMVGAIFQEAPEVEFPKAFEDFLKDITLTNVTFQMFMQETGKEIMHVARYGVLVDMPAEVTGSVARPYCVGYKAEDIINWRTERQEGDEVLTMVVLHEHVQVANAKDAFCSDLVSQYRVLELKNNVCTVQLWRETEDKSKGFVVYGPEVTPQRRGQALDFIPFVFMGATCSTPDLETPPLLDLADVNLAHFRNSTDHEWGLHLVALPTPWVAGVAGGGAGNSGMKIGPSVVWELAVQGSAGMLEFSGTGLASLVTAMAAKEKQMAVLGARLLESQAQVQETASAVRMRHSDEHANIRTVAQSIEQGFSLVLQMVAWWAGTEDKPIDTEANVELNKEYLNVKASAQEVQVALTALQAGEISFETWWNLLTTGGWGREGIDAEAERTAIDAQKAARAAMAPDDPQLSPMDPAAPVAPKRKTITGPDGKVKYQITEG